MKLMRLKAAGALLIMLILLGFMAVVAVKAWMESPDMFWRMILDVLLVAALVRLWRELSDLGSSCDIKASRLEERDAHGKKTREY